MPQAATRAKRNAHPLKYTKTKMFFSSRVHECQEQQACCPGKQFKILGKIFFQCFHWDRFLLKSKRTAVSLPFSGPEIAAFKVLSSTNW